MSLLTEKGPFSICAAGEHLLRRAGLVQVVAYVKNTLFVMSLAAEASLLPVCISAFTITIFNSFFFYVGFMEHTLRNS